MSTKQRFLEALNSRSLHPVTHYSTKATLPKPTQTSPVTSRELSIQCLRLWGTFLIQASAGTSFPISPVGVLPHGVPRCSHPTSPQLLLLTCGIVLFLTCGASPLTRPPGARSAHLVRDPCCWCSFSHLEIVS